MTDDLSLLRSLAALMGWRIYTEQAGDYNRWQRHLVKEGGDGSCFIDLDGRFWVYDNPAPYINAHERLWNPLSSMDDAMQIVEHLRTRTTGQRYWCEMRTPWMEGDTEYMARFTPMGFTGRDSDHKALAPTPQRAICLAALQVAGEEKPDA